MRRFLLLVTVTATLVACAEDPAPIPPATSPEPTVDPIDETRLDIYESLSRELVGVEEIEWKQIVVLTKLCEAAGEPAAPAGCEDSLSPQEQEALTTRLEDLGAPVTFVDDTTSLYDENWLSGELDMIVLRLGTIAETATGVEVGGSFGCGGLCGSGTTYRLEETSDGWEVTGTTGTAWIA
jgi:hypothetical protein